MSLTDVFSNLLFLFFFAAQTFEPLEWGNLSRSHHVLRLRWIELMTIRGQRLVTRSKQNRRCLCFGLVQTSKPLADLWENAVFQRPLSSLSFQEADALLCFHCPESFEKKRVQIETTDLRLVVYVSIFICCCINIAVLPF